jgi:hypothetical protein
MSDVSLAARACAHHPTSCDGNSGAPVVVTFSAHADGVNGGTLDAGRPGQRFRHSDELRERGVSGATLTDTLTDITSVTNIEIGGSACGGCSATTSSVTAPYRCDRGRRLGGRHLQRSDRGAARRQHRIGAASPWRSLPRRRAPAPRPPTWRPTIGSQNVPTVEITKKSGQAIPRTRHRSTSR